MSTHLIAERVDGNSKGTCETKVTELELAALGKEKILGLEIPVEDSVIVAEGDALGEKRIQSALSEESTSHRTRTPLDARAGVGT